MEIENYRQFTDEVINFDKDLTILAGANNSGKTSIVELFKIVFQKKSFSVDDISASKYPELQKKFIDEINTIREECSTKLEFREKIKKKYSGLEDESLTIIKINIEVEYDQDERIFAFSDYLMDIDESCKSFYFSYRFEVNANELRSSLSEVSDEFFPDEAQDSKDVSFLKKNNESNNYGEVLKKIFETSLINKIYFTDKDYQNKQEMSGESFQKLFNMNSVKATRLLDDEKEDRHFSISKELLRHFKASEGWEEFREAIIADIKERLDSRRLNEQIKVHSLDNVQKNIERYRKSF